MNPEIKAKWVAALRSGEYKQGVGKLHYGDKFCCLGVLCDLHAKEDHGKWSLIFSADRTMSYMGVMSSLPSMVAGWSGLPVVSDSVLIGDEDLPLYRHNDDGRTFAEIADAIEGQL